MPSNPATLQDQYQTLLRRGMPEHEGVRFIEYSGAAEILSAMGDDDYMALNGSDARDLITMHALRWWLSTGSHTTAMALHWMRIVGEDRVALNCGAKEKNGGETFRHNNILDALLLATAFLEPGEGKHPGSKGS